MNTNKLLIALLVIFNIGGITYASYAQELKTANDSLSYSAGIMFAKNLDDGKVENVDADILAQALKDYDEGKTSISVDMAQTYYGNYINKIKEKEMNEAKEAGEKFLSANAKKEGVIVTESGLQYEVINEGSGASPSATDKVLAHYHGTLIDGRVFDSSVERNEPITLPVNRVIQGWQEALQLMKTGSKWRLYIPYNLAYGAQGAGPLIGPYSALIFDVELLEIQ